tara:strand:- start:398 stop:1084 length:687 start_codon:yes stop_codon:yes gene_type:complete
MKKFYRVILLLIAFIFLSTYNPNKFNLISEKSNSLFEIQNIIIINNFLLTKTTVNEKLSRIYNKNIFLIKRKDIESLLKDIDFLKEIEVKKKYPNTLIVKIFETKPVAILFKDKNKYLLDNSSNLISYVSNMNFNHLPSVFGNDAENHFVYFFNQLENNNFPSKKIKNFYYFQIGRWDLQLLNNKIIKLPPNNTDDAIKKSVELLNREDFKNYNIIDLRVDGKIIVEE